MRIASLCTGSGMLDLAVQNVLGGELAFVADNDRAASKLLSYRFPDILNLGDIKTIDWDAAPKVDVLCAGFPCQPISDAGRQLGINDERWLWPDILRAIRILRPRIVVLENVVALLGRGFPEVSGSLAEIGMDIRWTSVRATAVGAPHRRERLFAIAYPHSEGLGWCNIREVPDDEFAPRSEQTRLPAAEHSDPGWWGEYGPAIRRWETVLGRPAPYPVIARPLIGATTTRINPAFSEWMMGMPMNWVCGVPGLLTKRKLILVGNSVVAQQAEYALRELLQMKWLSPVSQREPFTSPAEPCLAGTHQNLPCQDCLTLPNPTPP